MKKVTLNEAATFLGLTKQTLRNWDRSGKLQAERDPNNGYRIYDLDDLKMIKEETAHYEVATADVSTERINSKNLERTAEWDAQGDTIKVRRQVGRLHNIIRDTSSNSSIIERFDEISKLLFLRALSENATISPDIFSQVMESDEEHAEKLRRAYNDACKQYPTVIPPKFQKLSLPAAALASASPVLEQITIIDSRHDVKGVAFEEIIRNTFEKGDNQQFFTPDAVTEFTIQMLNGNLGERVCDPACGTGGFLVEILKQGHPIKQLTGLEIDQRLAWTTGINLLTHGCSRFSVHTLESAGSLGPEASEFYSSFDTIVTNPPFGSDLNDRETLQSFELGKGVSSRRRGILFLEQCLNLLKPGGRLAIVIDEGVLSLPSTADVRTLLLRRATLEAVVSLPETTFMPYATVNSSILVLKNEKGRNDYQTFFAKANNIGRKSNGDPDFIYDESGHRRLNNDLPEIASAWNTFNETGRIDPRKDNVFSARLPASTDENDNRIDVQFHHPSRFNALETLNKSTAPISSLFELCDERGESMVPRREAETPTLRFTGLAQIESHTGKAVQIETPSASLRSAVKKYHPGDILFARMRPNLRKCHFVQFKDAGYTSAECVILTPRKGDDGEPIILPELLAVILRSELVYGQLIHRVAGIGRPRISIKDLRLVRIPVPTKERQRALLEGFHQQINAASALHEEARALVEEANETMSLAVDSLVTGISK